MKVVLVTGVSSGIGKATAARLSEIGFRTFGTVRTPIAQVGNVEIVPLDVRDSASAEECVATVFERAGRIVNISSVLGFLPAPFMSAYAATKHAVEGYSESLDHEVRGFGVRVSVVEPGFTRTGLGHNTRTAQRLFSEYGHDRERVVARLMDNIDHGADPALVADVVARAV